MTTPLVSVVTAVRGDIAAIAGLLTCLAEQDLVDGAAALETIVVDNNPRPSFGLLADAALPIQVVHEPVPGLSRARNAGIRRARGSIVAITDPDSLPEPGWVRALCQAFADDSVVCVGGRTLPYLPDGGERGIPQRLADALTPGQWPDQITELRRPYWIIGCNMAFRQAEPPLLFSEDFGRVGRRLRSCEDLEIVTRAQRRGRVVVAPDAVVQRAVHPADLTLRRTIARSFWQGVCIARLKHRHPHAEVYDSYRLRDLFTQPSLTAAVRIAGYRAEQLRTLTEARPGTKEDGY